MHSHKIISAAYTKEIGDVYDAIYSWKDYKTETSRLKKVITEFKKSPGKALLEVGCGTGLYLQYLTDTFQVKGVDLSVQQLEAAHRRVPQVDLVQADMRSFDLNHQFDIVICLFNSIAYLCPVSQMQLAIQNMAKHLKIGGVLIVEPWSQPPNSKPNHEYVEIAELPDKKLKVTRTTRPTREGNISILTMHHKVETQSGIEEFSEQHCMGLYSKEEYMAAFKTASLSFHEDKKGLWGRSIYVGNKKVPRKSK
jgi:dTDP-3-amino-3,4,6-trideoxy-alpha-D-glucopyranose N,N-dimethyltransferase